MCRVTHCCIYATLVKINQSYAERLQATTKKEKRKIFKRISKHAIKNALTNDNVPLSDLKHGPFKMTPPELLHTSGSGIMLYMFSVSESGMSKSELCALDEHHKELITLFLSIRAKEIIQEVPTAMDFLTARNIS